MGRVDLVARREGQFFRLFAQKRLRADLVDDPDVRRMFLDEARLAGLLRHPNVVSVIDVGEDQSGPFLVMEFVEGVPLSQLTRAAERGERIPLEVCLRIAGQVAEGLHAVHELRAADGEFLQLVHRDVSPQNILVGFDGIARVTDFGIAKALGRASKTATGILKGKLGYMSPEQLRFEEIDRRADLFAFGVVLFEMLTGQRLYQSQQDMDGPRRILNEPPPDLADHRDDVEPEHVELMFELLAKDRAHRPATARIVARRLEGMLASAVASRDCVDTGAYLESLFAQEHEALRQDIAAIDQSLTGVPQASSARKTGGGAEHRRARRVKRGLSLAVGAVAAAFAVQAAWGPFRTEPISDSASTPAETRATMAPAAMMGAAELSSTVVPERRPAAESAAAAAPLSGGVAPAKRLRMLRKTKVSRPASPLAEDDCTRPYTIDSRGQKQFKVHCLVDVRR
jgi:serine/threonine-protein kinase